MDLEQPRGRGEGKGDRDGGGLVHLHGETFKLILSLNVAGFFHILLCVCVGGGMHECTHPLTPVISHMLAHISI